MLRAPRRCEHELGRAIVRTRLPHDLCPARALRGRCRHGVRAKVRGRWRCDDHVRAGRDATHDRTTRSRARASAARRLRRGSAAEERLVQPGNRPGASDRRNGRRLSSFAHASAHAGRNTRRVPAGAPRTPPRRDRRAVRSAGPAVGRTDGPAQAFAQIIAAPVADPAASGRFGQRG